MSPLLQSLAGGSSRGYRTFVTAAGPGFESIASATGTGSAGAITFSSIPSTYQSLQLRGHFTTTVSGQSPFLIFNNDTSTVYARHQIAATGFSQLVNAQISVGSMLPGAYNGSSNTQPCVFIVDIENYANTTIAKVMRYFSGLDLNGASSVVEFGSGLWANTNAITRMDVTCTGSFTTSSTFALYGIKGA